MAEPAAPGDTLDKRQVRAAFDRAASTYDEAAVLQREVGRRLLERLELMRLQPRRVCDLGAGTGLATRALMGRYARATVVALDLAPAMLERARRRAPLLRRLRCVCADLEALPLADASCDLLFSNLALQWVNDLDRACRELRRVLRPGGCLLFSTFGPDTLRELREAWAVADGGQHVNTFLDMHDIGDALVRAGLADPVMDVEHFTLTYRALPDLMRELKALGAHVVAGRATGLTGRRRLAAVAAAYESRRRDGRLPATFEVVYGHGWGPPQRDELARVAGPGRAVFALDQLRRKLRDRHLA